LLLQEVETSSDLNSVVTILNGIYGPGAYSAATFTGFSSGGGLPAMVYRNASVDLVATVAMGTVNTSANARQTIRYTLRPDGYAGNDATFYVYNSHYKAGNSMDGTDQNRRNVEATFNRNNAALLGAAAHVIYAGDLNLASGNEAAFQTLIAPGAGQATDPINAPLNWGDVSGLRHVHTQSPATTAFYDGQITGGMDDRYDFQLPTGPLRDNEGLAYISGSYRAFGNNGTHPLNGAINSPQNTWNPPGLTIAAATIKSNLAQVSDHVPLVADYQIPAKMTVTVGPVPQRVIVGATVGAQITVSNTAPVVAAIGADELDYAYSGAGLSGAGNGVATALAPGNAHTLAFDTATPGVRSGTVTVSSTSQGAASANVAHAVSTTVLAHSNASFDSTADADALTIDFGIRARATGTVASDFSIFNLREPGGFTAALDLDSVVASGDVARLSSNAAPFTNLAASGSQSFGATLDTSNVGSLSTTYTLNVSDENIPGATSGPSLTLALLARVAIGGDANLDDTVNLNDFNILAANFGATGAAWTSGDFTNDALVNLNDFNVLAANFGMSASGTTVTPEDWAALASGVPEPGALSLLGLAPLLLERRRWVRFVRRDR
jgi:hypothetical protein